MGDDAEGKWGGVDELCARVGRLSHGQREVLLLVAEHLSSKEIAVRLRISPHTVDQRIRGALQILGVERRAHAARLVLSSNDTYQQLIHQSGAVERGPAGGKQEGAVGIQIRHIDRAGGAGSTGLKTEQRSVSDWSSLPLPFATRSNPRNEMSVGARLFWIVMIAIGAAFAAGAYLAGLESLARLGRLLTE